MLRHLDEQDAANQVKYAVHSVYREGKHITRDMGGLPQPASLPMP